MSLSPDQDQPKLTAKQTELLRWIARGCPEGVMQDQGYRISVAALRHRGLATTSGRGTAWRAQITRAGRRYLAELDGVAPEELDSGPGPLLGPSAGAALDADLHPVARDFHDRIERHEVSRAQLCRATAIVQSLVSEAQQRGWEVELSGYSRNEVGLVDWSSAKDGHFIVSVGEHHYWLRLQEEGVRTRTALEDDDAPTTLPADAYDADGTGRLRLELRWGPWFTRQQTRFQDRPDAPLQDRIEDVLREIEQRAAQAMRAAGERHAHELAAGAEAAVQVHEREQELTAARALQLGERRAEDRRVDALMAQVDGFERAARIRAFCDAAEARRAAGGQRAAGVGDAAETVAWIAWARAYADRIDPLSDPAGPRAPEDLAPPR